MAIRVGILTSGGDCPGLNATIRGVAKALYHRMGSKVEIVGIMNGYDGLINGNYREMSPDEFSGILTVGGTILGTKRTPFKKMRVVEEDKVDKVAAMKKNYRAAKLDCLLCLGGNGTHKTANLLSQEGLNVIGLPKTIDNDIYGTDVTFGFHTAVDIATEVIDRIHTTAGSHSRVMCIEIMGNKAGWLTLYSGIAGGADIILLPELPYDIKKVAAAVENRAKAGKNFSILAVAELQAKSPLRHVGLTKQEIRDYSHQLGLPTWDKQSFACLSSRFVYGEEITAQKLGMVDKAEQLLLDLGFHQLRVRIHGTIARIEVLPTEFEKLLQNREQIVAEFKKYGFTYVTMDLQGYRMGSMNETLNLKG